MGNPLLTGFGERLKAARTRAGLSGTELGKGLQLDGDASRQTVSDWEAERHYPNVWQLAHICAKVDESADALLGLPVRNGLSLSSEEHALLTAYRNLPENERPAVLRASGAPQLGKARIGLVPRTERLKESERERNESALRQSTLKPRAGKRLSHNKKPQGPRASRS